MNGLGSIGDFLEAAGFSSAAKFEEDAFKRGFIEGQKAMRSRVAEYVSDKWDFLGE